MRKSTSVIGIAIILSIAAVTLLCAATPAMQDGGTIVNSGSTNNAKYTIKIHADGHGILSVQNAPDKPFTVDPSLAEKFLASAQAARANPGTPGHCMKSASFGTTTTVTWHNWTSSDLECPPFNAQMAMLAHQSSAIQQAAGVGFPMRRIRLPGDQRLIRPGTPPSAEPSATEPSATAAPSMSPSP